MLARLRDIRDRTAAENPYQGDLTVRELRARLDALPAAAPAVERWRLLAALGEGLVLLGREREGLDRLLEAKALLPDAKGALPPGEPQVFAFRLGIAWLRLGETENCCARASPEACILPLRGEAVHGRPEGARQAVACFREVLEGTPPETPAHDQARWLLHLATMALGEAAEPVPAAWRIPDDAFASEQEFPRFENAAARMGLATLSLSGGVVAEDFDGDGDPDLMVSRMETDGPIRYWRNDGGGRFTDRTREANLEGIYGGLNLIQADYDNDGHCDVLVLRGAWFGAAGLHPNSLLRNRGDGTFTDVAYDAGIAGADFPTQTADWADIDRDGDLDLFVGNESTGGLSFPCQLFRNRGDGTFEGIARRAGVDAPGFVKGSSFGDPDGDGLPDLYVSILGGENRLYVNRGDGTFRDAARERGVTGPRDSFPCWFFDFDNDGAEDLFVAGFPAPPADLAAAALGRPTGVGVPRLYRGDGAAPSRR